MRKPGSTCCSLIRLRIVRPAPISSMKDAATCTTISALRMPCGACVTRPLSRERRRHRQAAVESRNGAEDQPGGHRDEERIEQDGRVDVDFGRARREALGKRDQQLHAQVRQHKADGAADHARACVLSVSSCRSRRVRLAPSARADGHLALAANHARQHQVRDAGADNQQHECGRPEEDEQRAAKGLRQSAPAARGDGAVAAFLRIFAADSPA